MGLASTGQLIDRYSALFLPNASVRDRRFVGGIIRPPVAKLTPSTDQAIEMGQVSFDLYSLALVHRFRIAVPGKVNRNAQSA